MNVNELAHCCKEFEDSSTYNDEVFEPPIEYSDGWQINGCCGHCYVVTDIKYCPFCGTKLPQYY